MQFKNRVEFRFIALVSISHRTSLVDTIEGEQKNILGVMVLKRVPEPIFFVIELKGHNEPFQIYWLTTRAMR